MSKTCKKLLASAIAATMLISTFVSSLVVSAATIGTLEVGTATIEQGTTKAEVDLTFTYGTEVTAPHKLITLTSENENFTLDNVVVKEVNDKSDYVVPECDEDGIPLAPPTEDIEYWPAYISGVNSTTGEVMLETYVDENYKQTFKNIVLTATYTIPTDTAVSDEDGYAITASASATDYDETDYEDLKATGSIIVKAAHSCTAGEYTDNGDGTHDIACAENCGKLFADNEKHTYTEGTCACGAEEPVVGPVVDSNLEFYRVSLAYGTSSLELNFRIANTVLDLYPNVEVVIVPQKYDMTTLNLVENPTEIVIAKANLAAAGTRYKQYTFTDIQLYELGLNIDYMLRAYDANGELVAISEISSMSAANYLKDMAADTTNTDGVRAMFVDTLVVCDEVMKNVAKSYTTSDLADAVATGSVLDGVDMSLATQTIGECNTVDDFVSYDDNFVQTNGATHQIRSSVAIGKVPYINFRVRDAQNALDLNKLEINVKYTSIDSAGEHPYDKTFSGADLTDGTFINCVFAEIGFHDSNKDIFFTVSYDGEKKCEWTYSIETYLNSMKDDPVAGAQMIAIIKLGQSFRSAQGL